MAAIGVFFCPFKREFRVKKLLKKWGLILGGSSGIGLSSAKKLASEGMNLIILHRDRRGAMAEIDLHFAEIRAHGVELLTINQDALDPSVRRDVIGRLSEVLKDGKISLLLHSIALGNLKPIVSSPKDDNPVSVLDEEDFERAIYNMGSSLLFWVQDLHRAERLATDTRVIGLTSEGNQIAWPGYAAVSAAKCTLESVARSIAKEFAPYGIRANILQPGVTDTKAFRLIPGSEHMKAQAESRNPMGRITRPEDVANVVYLMTLPEAAWINGAILRVDGGEAISHG